MIAALICFAIAALLVWLMLRQNQGGSWIDPDDPLFVEAANKARASVATLRELHAAHPKDIGVKFPFRTSTGETEHVWGPLLELRDTELVSSIETRPRSHQGPLPPTVTVPLAELEDWHLSLPDGRIRGSYTTQAQIRIQRNAGQKLPRHIADMESRFVDH